MFTFNVLIVEAVSIDCPDIINLAKGLGIQSKQASIWTSLQSDCCTASGVTCVSQRVTQIDWRSKTLNGIINGTAITSGITSINLNTNQINGSVPFFPMNGLTYIDLSRNQLTGAIPLLFPMGLTYLDLSFNSLTGQIPSNLPDGITVLGLDNNQLTGSIPSTLPSGLQTFGLHCNQLGGNLPSFPISLNSLHLGRSGSPDGNHFTGTLILIQPIEIWIHYNWITDVFLFDTSLLARCDLSYNPLLGNPSIVAYTMCTKTGLYSASLLPYTVSTNIASTALPRSTTMKVSSSGPVRSVNLPLQSILTTGSAILSSTSTKSIGTSAILFQMTSGIGTQIALTLNTKIPSLNFATTSPTIFDATTQNATTTTMNNEYLLHARGHVFSLINLIKMGFKLLINTIILTIVICLTPWYREWRSKLKRQQAITSHTNLSIE